MSIDKVLITGSCGLVGSESVRYFCDLGCQVIGIDNNHRKDWFGEEGDTSVIKEQLKEIPSYRHIHLNITDENGMRDVIGEFKPDLLIHAAAQPSHEKSAEIPFADFKVNALGTINLLEAVRTLSPDTIFVFVSTNKVYGDLANHVSKHDEVVKWFSIDEDFPENRLVLSDPYYNPEANISHKAIKGGVHESFRIDRTLHTPFGASKLAADIMVQEYGLYYGLNTVCFRCGCITGKNHQGVEQHGFLSYLCSCAQQDKEYKIFGWKGKQVRDNLHASDLVRAFHLFAKSPKQGAVYNIGGGKENSCSVLEAIEMIEKKTGKKMKISFGMKRKGDHGAYFSSNYKFQSDYKDWKVTKDLDSIIDDLLV